MKKFTFFILLAAFALTGKSEGLFDLGLKTGFNTSKSSTPSSLKDLSEGVNSFQIGAFARINLGPAYFQPEVYYNSKAGEVIELDNINITTKNSFDYKTVDVPALIGFKLIDKKPINVRVMAGPVFSFVTDKGPGVKNFDEAYVKDNFFGWQYGAGADFMFLTLDVRMQSNSNSIYTAPDFKTKGVFIVSLGVKLY